MKSRAIVAVAVIALLGVGGKAAADELRVRREQAAWEAGFARVGERVASIAVPQGLTSCAEPADLRKLGLLCWEGEGDPVRIAVDLAAALRSVGAEDVRPHCARHKLLGPVCVVSARVAGMGYRADVMHRLPPPGSRPPRTFTGVSVSGARDLIPLPELRGTPIELPAGS